jgi:hypothetical protein
MMEQQETPTTFVDATTTMHDKLYKDCTPIKLPNDRWQLEYHDATTDIGKDHDSRCVVIDIDHLTWELLCSAPFFNRLLTKNIYAIKVYCTNPSTCSQTGEEGSSSRCNIFGLLVDSYQKPVSPGTTFLAREVYKVP